MVKLISEAIESGDFGSFVTDEEGSDHIHFVVALDSLAEVMATPLILANGVLATSDIEAACMVAEKSNFPCAVCFIPSEELSDGDLQPLSGKNWRESMAMTGFCRLELTSPSAKVRTYSATGDDIRETVETLAAMHGGESPWRAEKVASTGSRSVWHCRSPHSASILVTACVDEVVCPWCFCRESDLATQTELASEFGHVSDLSAFSERTKTGRLPQRMDFALREDVFTEMLRPRSSSSARLKKIVGDILNHDPEFRGKVKDIGIKGDKLSIKVGRRTYIFDIDRDGQGMVTGVRFSWPKHRTGEMTDVQKLINKAFKEAGFRQVLTDACSEAKPKLVMLDYIRLNGGHRTRLVEPYSYRFKASTGRTYFYGWNVEEGGIRSYIADRVQGARKTDKPFTPRFLVEIGAAHRARKGHAYPVRRDTPEVVTNAVIERAHKRFDLKGGYGKIIKRLGRSVDTPYAIAKERAQKRYEKAQAELTRAIAAKNVRKKKK